MPTSGRCSLSWLSADLYIPVARAAPAAPRVLAPLRAAPPRSQRGLIVSLEKYDSLPMSTNRPTAPVMGAALVSVTFRT